PSTTVALAGSVWTAAGTRRSTVVDGETPRRVARAVAVAAIVRVALAVPEAGRFTVAGVIDPEVVDQVRVLPASRPSTAAGTVPAGVRVTVAVRADVEPANPIVG